MSRRFPWANANRIADDHRLEVAQIERQADRRAYRRADFFGSSPSIYLPPDEIAPVESNFLRLMVIYSIASLGVTAAICFGLIWLGRSL